MAQYLIDRLYLYRIENTFYHDFRKQNSDELSYPHTTKVIQKLSHLDIEDPITIICGDNGCGKSTLLKGIAEQLNANRITSVSSYEKARVVDDNLFDFLKLKTSRRAKRNFFFTGEDFIKYIEWLENTKKESKDAIQEIDEIYGDTYAGMLAKQPHQRTIYDIKNMYGEVLANKSHGEGFVTFFRSRIINNGLYILDEPESALSYENQYLIAILIRDAVKKGCQFIIATHSPIITAIPEAGLYEIKEGVIEKTTYESLENVQFLNMFVRKRHYLFEEE